MSTSTQSAKVTRTPPAAAAAAGGDGGASKTMWVTIRVIVLTVGAILMIAPFVIMLATSLSPNTVTLPNPPKFVPSPFTINNYQVALTENNFGLYFMNSAYVAILTTIAVLVVSSMLGFAFARFDFAFKNVAFALLLAGLMIPGVVVIVPQFILAKNLGLIDSLSGLALFYTGGGVAFTTFLLRGFFERVPRELEEAMTVDGASIARKFWQLYLPLVRPALATAAIFTFLGAWDEYVWALTVVNDVNKRTIQLGIAAFSGEHGTAWGLVFAGSTLAVIPVIIIYIIGQKQLLAGQMTGAVK
jgi:multiple sugar transport system permease protein